MDRYRSTNPRAASLDNETGPAGDNEFLGVAMLAPARIPPGYVAEASNVVFDNRVAETRPGKALLRWLNPIDADNRLAPWTRLYGLGTFRDPNAREYVLIAADGALYRGLENNSLYALPLPAGVRISGPVNFIQAFSAVICQQGLRLPNLILNDLAVGWTLAVPDWDPTATYASGDIRAYGDEVEIASISLAGSLATVTTVARHGFQTNDRVYLYWERRSQLATAFAITVTGDEIFTFNFASPASALTPVNLTATSAGTTATATSVAHGLVTGRRITISGANQANYNGTFTITVTGVDTFTYTMIGAAASPATGTITWLPVTYASRQTKFWKASAGTAAGESPVTTPGKWTAWTDFQAPWTLGACFLQNRVFYMGTNTLGIALDNSSAAFQKDLVAASEALKYASLYALKDEFRINQGDADALVAIAAFNKRAFVAFKGRSLYLLGNVVGDLSGITQDRIPTAYGCAARRSVALVGTDLWFLSAEPAVRSLYQTDQNEVLGRDARMSLPIDPLMRRLNTTLLSGACACFAGGKYHLAVPLDDAATRGPAQRYSSGGTVALPQTVVIAGNGPGARFLYRPNPAHAADVYWNGKLLAPDSEFTAGTGTLQVRSAASSGVYDFDLCPVLRGNNAILTYNTKTESWEGVHQGEGIYPIDWATATVNGRERALFTSQDGCVYLWGEGRLDQVVRAAEPLAGIDMVEIVSEVLSRGYDYQVAGLKKFDVSRVALQTWRPRYTLSVKFEGVADELALDVPVTKSRTAYFTPWDAPAFNPNNVNGDHATPGREDYAVPLANADAFYLGDAGVDFERDQESEQVDRITHGKRDRLCQLRFRNEQGYARLNAIELEGEPGERTGGVHQ